MLIVQVPYTLVDEDIPDDWACEHNSWDPDHQSCAVPQALSDERIDEILLQQVQLEVTPWALVDMGGIIKTISGTISACQSLQELASN